ncbi:MAG: DUF5606 domain-containing protein [Bacteroidota bacterium]
MDLSKVMAISGKSGLYKIISQSKASIIVESLTDGKKMPVFATHRSSVLEDISMFTYTEDVPLKKVLWNMYQKEDGKEASVDTKADANELKQYFEEVLPDFDQERVYPSDIKKVISWYNQLLKHDMISEPKDEEEAPDQSEGDSTSEKDELTDNTKESEMPSEEKKSSPKIGSAQSDAKKKE